MAGVQIKNHLLNCLKYKTRNVNPVSYIKDFIRSKLIMINVYVEKRVKSKKKIQMYMPLLLAHIIFLMS